MCIDYWLIFGEVYGTVYVKTIGGGTLDRWQEAGALIGRQENYRDSHAGELLEELVVESLGNLCGRCRDGVGFGQTGKGGWVCGRKAGGRERHRALPWVAQFLPEEVSFPTFHFFFPPILHLKPEVTLCLGTEQSTWPHDPVTPSSPTRGPGELPAEGAASSRWAAGARTAR